VKNGRILGGKIIKTDEDVKQEVETRAASGYARQLKISILLLWLVMKLLHFLSTLIWFSAANFDIKNSGIFPFQPFFLAEPLLCGDMIVAKIMAKNAKIITNTPKKCVVHTKSKKKIRSISHNMGCSRESILSAVLSLVNFSSFYSPPPLMQGAK